MRATLLRTNKKANRGFAFFSGVVGADGFEPPTYAL
jgi:hypothetical protein